MMLGSVEAEKETMNISSGSSRHTLVNEQDTVTADPCLSG